MRRHTDWVNALTIISSTEYIVSGSDDKTIIKVWNSTYPFQLIVTLEGHTYLVSSLAIIPSNENIMSKSWDFTIKVWYFFDSKKIRQNIIFNISK